MKIGERVSYGEWEDVSYYQSIVDAFNAKYGTSVLAIKENKNDYSHRLEVVVNESVDFDCKSAFEEVMAEIRFNNPENPYDTKYPFLRKDFVHDYEKAQQYGVSYTEYKEGFIKGKFVEPANTDTPFRLEKSEEEQKGNVMQRDDGSCYRAYYDSDGNLERIYSVPSEAVGLNQSSRLFFEKDKVGYQMLVDEFNKVNGQNVAQIFGNEKDGYHVYMDPNWSSSPEFYEIFLNLENAIALDYHPNLTKAQLLSYIQSEEMREKYMENPSRELLLDIFRSQIHDKGITPTEALKSALQTGITAEKTDEATSIEDSELNPQKVNEGETIDGE